LEAWLREQRARLSNLAALAKPLDDMLQHWDRTPSGIRSKGSPATTGLDSDIHASYGCYCAMPKAIQIARAMHQTIAVYGRAMRICPPRGIVNVV
jgi:hypothetical protein